VDLDGPDADIDQQDIVVVEAWIDPHQIDKAADEQPGPDERSDRQRHLDDHQQAPQLLTASARRR
jgi:hypothetical protein